MNKIAVNFLSLSFILFFSALIPACSTEKDRFAEFRNQNEARIFSEGEHALAKGDYTQAIKNFEALEVEFPFGSYTEQAKLDIIYAYYKHEDSPAALDAAKRFIQLYPRGAHVDYAYYMIGVINFENGWNWVQRHLPDDRAQHDLIQFQEAFNNFKELIRLFPHSIYRADAHTRMIYIRNTLARNEIQIAEFYLRKKAYAAARERAMYVIEKYQGAPQVNEALKIIAKVKAIARAVPLK